MQNTISKPSYMDEYVTKTELKSALKAQTIEIAELISDMGNRVAEQLQSIQSDIKELKDDVRQLKADVKVLKSDVKKLKADVKDLKADVHELKADMKIVKLTLKRQAGAMSSMSHTLEGLVTLNPSPKLKL